VYECSVFSVACAAVRTADGVEIVTQSIRQVASTSIDTLIVPGPLYVADVTRDQDSCDGGQESARMRRVLALYASAAFCLQMRGA